MPEFEAALAAVVMRIMGEQLGPNSTPERDAQLGEVMRVLKATWPNEMDASRRRTFFAASEHGGATAAFK